MITEKFSSLIEQLSNCNGTCRSELQKHVENGEISEEDAVYVYIYSMLKRMHKQVDTWSVPAD